MTTADHLLTALDTEGVLSPAWRDAFLATPRHAFLPAQIWVDDSHGEPQPIDRKTEPDRWWESAYANATIVTQYDDGATVWPAIGIHRTSSASEPAMVATTLDCLDVQHGQRVLEIGTGTGYNTALLAHRLGASQVTTMEIDPLIAGAAKTALDAAGLPVTTIIRDGAAGCPARAPYDRVIATSPHISGPCGHAVCGARWKPLTSGGPTRADRC